MSSSSRHIKEEINRLIDQVSQLTEIQVVRSAYIMEHGRRILRVTITGPGGVTLDMCETFSRALSEMLDREDMIEEKYYLEVESPGI